jgi:hypothetical protein
MIAAGLPLPPIGVQVVGAHGNDVALREVTSRLGSAIEGYRPPPVADGRTGAVTADRR